MPGHRLLARQQRVRAALPRAASCLMALPGASLRQLTPMPVQARGAEFIVARQLRGRFPGGEAGGRFLAAEDAGK